ncbi:MAG: peroxisome biogenesis factor 10 [Stictis urceolatum]|nr:peroxisome biogenesis factor 10 [Stictis urceolata]
MDSHVNSRSGDDTRFKLLNPNEYQYPFAAAPDIIRSNQKDIYFQGTLLESISTVLRKIYGARFLHKFAPEARTFADLLYLSCTTLIGNRTLGEEYCDIVQIEGNSRKLPAISRRSAYILSSVILPYVLERTLPGLRARIRVRLESKLSNKQIQDLTFSQKLQAYTLENLQTITSPAPLYAIGLSVFYFSGAYYHVSKRLAGLRYIFTKRIEPSDQRIGYEVLGVLLVLQMTVQSWLHVKSTVEKMSAGGTEATEVTTASEIQASAQSKIEANTHTPAPIEPRYTLAEQSTFGWIEGQQQRKCTLCLEELKDPSATTCGHVFCWTCIADWIREKPECPLCRQSIMSQHVLPLRG